MLVLTCLLLFDSLESLSTGWYHSHSGWGLASQLSLKIPTPESALLMLKGVLANQFDNPN